MKQNDIHRNSQQSINKTSKKMSLTQVDLQILQEIIQYPSSTKKEIAKYLRIPESTLRYRLENIQKQFPVEYNSAINYEKLNISPVFLITNNFPKQNTHQYLDHFSCISWRPKILSYSWMPNNDINSLRSTLPSTNYSLENLDLWQVCYSYHNMNLSHYRSNLSRWEYPWLNLRKWIIDSKNTLDLTRYPPITAIKPDQISNPFDTPGIITFYELVNDFHVSLREITLKVPTKISTTIIHRRRASILKNSILTPYVDISNLQTLASTLILYRNPDTGTPGVIPQTVQSIIQLAEEMPAYTYQILYHLPTHRYDYAIWIDIGWDDIRNIASIVTELPRSDLLEFYGWIKSTKNPSSMKKISSRITCELPPISCYNKQTQEWQGLPDASSITKIISQEA